MASKAAKESGVGKTVLLVDDDATVLTLMWQALAREGFTVVAATGGAQGLELVASRRPDVVVLDLAMPAVGGLEVLRNLRHDPQTRFLPVIVVTGKTDSRSAVESWMSGAEYFMRKPLQMDLLVREVKRLAWAEAAKKQDP